MSAGREITSWSDFGRAIDWLANDITKSGYKPDCILGIARGGLVVAGALAFRLGVKDLQSVNIEHYSGNGLDDVAMSDPRLLPPGLHSEPLTGKRVLVVDDVTDSGATLEFVSSLIGVVVEEQRSAVWYAKNRASIRPDYLAAKTDQWIVFPWSPHSPEAHTDEAGINQD